MKRISLIVFLLAAVVSAALVLPPYYEVYCPARDGDRPGSEIIRLWYGAEQSAVAQAKDFSLLGHIEAATSVRSLSYSVNGSVPEALSLGDARQFGDGRRLSRSCDFNAEIPFSHLSSGKNKIVLEARLSSGQSFSRDAFVQVTQQQLSLPLSVHWSGLSNPQSAGLVVDGHWKLSSAGLRTDETGYDRIFLLGSRDWANYQVTVPISVNRVDRLTGPFSGANGVGVIVGFQGYVREEKWADLPPELALERPGVIGELSRLRDILSFVCYHRRFPRAQPQWLTPPLGGIVWFRWLDGADNMPILSFYRGDGKDEKHFEHLPVKPGSQWFFKVRYETLLSGQAEEKGISQTRISWKIWPFSTVEPDSWQQRVVQPNGESLTSGGVALLAHHVDATFGDVLVESLADLS